MLIHTIKVRENNKELVYELTDSVVTIGRTANIHIHSKFVSKIACTLTQQNGNNYVFHLGNMKNSKPTNKIYINSIEATKSTALKNGDKIQFHTGVFAEYHILDSSHEMLSEIDITLVSENE